MEPSLTSIVELEKREERDCLLKPIARRNGGKSELAVSVEKLTQSAQLLNDREREIRDVADIGCRWRCEQHRQCVDEPVRREPPLIADDAQKALGNR